MLLLWCVRLKSNGKLDDAAGFDSLQGHGTSNCRIMKRFEVRAAFYSTRVERLSLRGKCCYSLHFTNHILRLGIYLFRWPGILAQIYVYLKRKFNVSYKENVYRFGNRFDYYGKEFGNPFP